MYIPQVSDFHGIVMYHNQPKYIHLLLLTDVEGSGRDEKNYTDISRHIYCPQLHFECVVNQNQTNLKQGKDRYRGQTLVLSPYYYCLN